MKPKVLELVRQRLRTHGIGHLLGVPVRRGREQWRLMLEQGEYRNKVYREPGPDLFAAGELAGFEGRLVRHLASHGPGLSAYLDGLITRYRDDPARRSTLLDQAGAACQGQFAIYGRVVDLGPRVDWCRDIDAGGRWQPLFFRRYRFGYRMRKRGDPRYVFELNRQQHLPLLAVAGRISGDPLFPRTAVQHMLQWIEDNPVFHSVNWSSSMEPALRLFSWGVTLVLLCGQERPGEDSLRRILTSLYQQYRFVLDNLSVDLQVDGSHVALKNNHTIVELCGVLFAWRLLGWMLCFSAHPAEPAYGERLLAELERQTWPDGMNVEQSTSYHRFVLEALLLVRLASDHSTVCDGLDGFIRRYSDALAFFCRDDDGDLILALGDDDNGHVMLGAGLSRPDDISEVRAMYAALGQAFPLPRDGATWLERGGHWICRWRWLGHDLLLYFRAGPMDFPDLPGYAPHAHCDLLAVSLYLDGRPMLLDCGTCSYAVREWRDGLRLESAHNTVALAGHPQAELTGPFSSRAQAHAEFTRYRDAGVTAALTYAGEDRARVIRSIDIDPQAGTIRFTDEISADPGEPVEWYLNPAPGARVTYTGITVDGACLALSGLDGLETEPAWYSPAYGEKEPITRLVARARCGDSRLVRRWAISLSEYGTPGGQPE